jgi:hypothetical protein
MCLLYRKTGVWQLSAVEKISRFGRKVRGFYPILVTSGFEIKTLRARICPIFFGTILGDALITSGSGDEAASKPRHQF